MERDLRYLIGRRGVPVLSRLDRVSLGRKRKRSQGSDAENQPPARRTGTHDDRVIQMATWFQKAGVPVHAGWRAVLNFPDETQIVPDAVVCLGDNPLGPGWFRLEYERSAVRRAAVRDKLWPYRHANFEGRRVPFLVVCDTADAEKVFQRESQGLPVLTSTYKELKTGPLLGEQSVWRLNGHHVPVHPPTPYSLEVPIVTSPLYTSRFARRG